MRRSSRLIAALVGLFGAAVSVTGSWIPSLWGDEAASITSAERPLPTLFSMLSHVDAVHGTYYLGLHFWIMLAGTSPFAMRLPSAIAVGVCVAGLVVLGTKLESLSLGVPAGVIGMFLPRILSIGDETRSYAFSAAIATWLTVLIVRRIQATGRDRRGWVGYGILLAIGIYLFLYLVLIAVAHAVVLLINRQRRALFRAWLITFGIAVAAALPLIVTGILEQGQIAYLGTRTEITFPTIAVSMWFGSTLFAIVAWALILVALVFLVVDRLPLPSVIGAAWLLIPVAILVGTHFVIPDFTSRYLAMSVPAAAVLMALALRRLLRRRPVLVGIAVALVVAAAVPQWITLRGPNAKNNSDWAEISANLAVYATPGQAVVFDDSTRPSRRTRLAMMTYPAGFAGLKDVTLKTPYYETNTWYDSSYTVPEAAALGRFDGVATVWLVDYRIGSTVDSYGQADLVALGFHRVATVTQHRSVSYEYQR